MLIEDFTPEPGRDLVGLIHALEPHGGAFTITSWTPGPDAPTACLYLPEDEYREKKCRQIIDRWRLGEPLPTC